jgi:hypothetical protein
MRKLVLMVAGHIAHEVGTRPVARLGNLSGGNSVMTGQEASEALYATLRQAEHEHQVELGRDQTRKDDDRRRAEKAERGPRTSGSGPN